MADLGEGSRGSGSLLILGEKKRRNHRRKQSQQSKQNNPLFPNLAQGLDPPLVSHKCKQDKNCDMQMSRQDRRRKLHLIYKNVFSTL